MFLFFYIFKILKKNNFAYNLLFILLWLMLSFRYGQGTDYFAYNYIFDQFNDIEMALLNPYHIHGEIGFRVLCSIFQSNYSIFIFFISTFEMFLLNKGINYYSRNKILSLLLFYPTIYLTYYFSAIRQGIVLSVFIGILLRYLFNNEIKKYYLVCFIMLLFHQSAFILFLIPLLKFVELKKLYLILLISVSIGSFFILPIGQKILQILPFYMYISSNQTINIFAIIERLTTFTIIMLLFIKNSKLIKKNENMIFMKIYILGIAIYMLFIGYPLVSSRIMIYFKSMEIFLFPILLEKTSKYKFFGELFIVILTVTMFFKNINAYIQEGNYKENVNVWNYPYIHVFNQEKLWDYKGTSRYYDLLD